LNTLPTNLLATPESRFLHFSDSSYSP